MVVVIEWLVDSEFAGQSEKDADLFSHVGRRLIGQMLFVISSMLQVAHKV